MMLEQIGVICGVAGLAKAVIKPKTVKMARKTMSVN